MMYAIMFSLQQPTAPLHQHPRANPLALGPIDRAVSVREARLSLLELLFLAPFTGMATTALSAAQRLLTICMTSVAPAGVLLAPAPLLLL
jgi:hypothetical protein